MVNFDMTTLQAALESVGFFSIKGAVYSRSGTLTWCVYAKFRGIDGQEHGIGYGSNSQSLYRYFDGLMLLREHCDQMIAFERARQNRQSLYSSSEKTTRKRSV